MFEWLRSLVGTAPDSSQDRDSRPLALETPGTWTLADDTDQELIVEATIRTSEQLYERNGRVPEEMAAVAISTALAEADLGYQLRLGFDPVTVPTQQAACRDESEGGDAKDHYAEIVKGWEEAARDANLLLTDAAGGGCSQYWQPRTASVGAQNLVQRRDWVSEGSDDWHSSVQSILHELGHCLGASHDHDTDQAGNQHPGMGWNDHEREVWAYTPTVFGNDVENRCGERVEEREYEEGLRVHEYHDCAVDVFETELQARSETE